MNNQSVALQFIQAADSNDFSALERLFGKQHQFHSTMSPVPMDTDQHLGMLKAFHSGFSNTRHEVLDLFASGNKVVLRGIWHADHTGTFNNIPASGRSVRLPFISIVEVENGEMRNQWLELDAMSMMMQIGAIPSPAEMN